MNSQDKKSPYQIAVLISGAGTTLRNLIERKKQESFSPVIALVVSSKSDAAGLEIARTAGIPTFVASLRQFQTERQFSESIFDQCRTAEVNLVVLAGFLKRLVIPDDFLNRVINIHPSLIPSFSGAGFYGKKVHQAVLDFGCKVSGCTVHIVDEHFDHGPIIAQQAVAVAPDDTAETLAARVFAEECRLYPDVINRIASEGMEVVNRNVRFGKKP